MKNRLKLTEKPMIWTVLLAVLIFLAAGIFVGNEMLQNSRYFFRYYQNNQQVLTNQIAEILEEKLEGGADTEVLIQYLENKVQKGGNSYPFLIENQQLCYIKDEVSTPSLRGSMEAQEYLAYIDQDNVVSSTTLTSGDREYIFGIQTNKNYLLLEWKVTKHTMYIVVAFVFLGLLLLCTMIGAMALIQRKNQQLKNYKKQEILQNQKLEQVNLRVEELQREMEEPKESQDGDIYDWAIAKRLLEKTTEPEYFPFSMIYLKLNMENRYYTKGQMQEIFQKLQMQLGKKQVLTEVAKGEFLLLLYDCNEEQRRVLHETLLKFVEPVLEQLHITGQWQQVTYRDIEVDLKEQAEQLLKKAREMA